MSSMVVYAGANDFIWSTYAKKDASWWSSSEATAHAHITYNDKAMVSVLKFMLEISQKSGAFSWVDSNYQKKADLYEAAGPEPCSDEYM